MPFLRVLRGRLATVSENSDDDAHVETTAQTRETMKNLIDEDYRTQRE